MEFDADTFADFVCSHGFGDATDEGYAMARRLWGDPEVEQDYAEIAFNVVSAGYVEAYAEEDE